MYHKKYPDEKERKCNECARPRVDRYEGSCWDACGKANPLCGEGDWDMYVPKENQNANYKVK